MTKLNQTSEWQQLCLPLQWSDSLEPQSTQERFQSDPPQERSRSRVRLKKSRLTSRNYLWRMVAVSRLGARIGEDAPGAKYTDDEVDRVLAMRADGMSYREIARIMDIPKSTVWAICRGLLRSTMVDRWVKKRCRI